MQTKTPTPTNIQAAYNTLLDADLQHAAQREPHTYARVLRAQRTYYTLTADRLRAKYAQSQPLRYARERAKQLLARAIQNKRSALTPEQTQTAEHQRKRALLILRRANNAIQQHKESTRALRHTKHTTRLVRTIHPITKRPVRVTQEQADQWTQQQQQ